MRDVSVLVGNRKSYLDHLGLFDVAFDQHVFAFLFGKITLFLLRSACNDTRKLGVLTYSLNTIAITL